MSRTLKVTPPANTGLLAMCREIWNDYKTGKTDYETLHVNKYAAKHAVRQFPKKLIAPLLLMRTEPTEEDADNFRVELNMYCYSKRGKKKRGRNKTGGNGRKNRYSCIEKERLQGNEKDNGLY